MDLLTPRIKQKQMLQAQMQNQKVVVKAPKLRFKPGQFVQDKKGNGRDCPKGQLYCITYCFRLISAPSEWIFCLEERSNLHSPNTVLSNICDELSGGYSTTDKCIVYTPVKTSSDAENGLNLYHHGNSICRRTKDLLQNFELISSGEVC